uniref:cytochrome c oxidase subunit III n=1 Tax=Bipalium admarginatum TaxID=3023024 RepID=UPI002410F2F6|nr:cytochrome c oxidase subunit III [Bipalium admarginatum]WEM34730.1 cytochrome c oxidase subunit 3 [Bipalium admarginatum]
MQTGFHLVNISPWPVLVAFSVGGLLVSSLLYFHYGIYYLVLFNVLVLIFFLLMWFGDIEVESWIGFHSSIVVSGLRLGIVLFIISEILFFFSFFWSFFHNCWSPSIILNNWPPFGFNYFLVDPYGFPLLNTVLLLSSGVSITLAHHSMMNCSYYFSLISVLVTLGFGFLFLDVQFEEYSLSNFSVNSLIYGSIFFLLTGFHGFHVMVGFCMISYSLFRLICSVSFSNSQHVGFEAAAWYWHFVDVVWIFLYFFIYWYGFMV